MNLDKKEELAEVDPNWDFEKVIVTTETGCVRFNEARMLRNELQTKDLALFEAITELDYSWFDDIVWRTKLFYQRNLDKNSTPVVFHHRGIYEFYKGLAVRLGVTVGDAALYVMNRKDWLRDMLGVETGGTIRMAELNLATEANSVSKDKLKQLVEDAKEKGAEEVIRGEASE